MIVLGYEKLKSILDNKFPPATQAETRKCWEESDEIGNGTSVVVEVVGNVVSGIGGKKDLKFTC
ncbi:hypothetical protein J1N35_019187 [Gossypium stocksii]|uniref:Uncharacterized protein n=1 Tax=Gossypium stocksii TaxID=47602 RepID=A0A9D4A7W8_9ROSI|nr:hypothetical protein J1N35_019187 [Gossypium stocksii]